MAPFFYLALMQGVIVKQQTRLIEGLWGKSK